MSTTKIGMWWCTKCARKVTSPVVRTVDPRYPLASCLHGKSAVEASPEMVPVVGSEATTLSLIDARRTARRRQRALRKVVTGADLTEAEQAAIASRP